METARSIAEKLLQPFLDQEETDNPPFDITSVSHAVSGSITGSPCGFDMTYDYETSKGVPARKRWRVSVTLVEDSTADDE